MYSSIQVVSKYGDVTLENPEFSKQTKIRVIKSPVN